MAKIEIDFWIVRDHVPIGGSVSIKEYRRKPGEEKFNLASETENIPPFLAEHRIRKLEEEVKARGCKLGVVVFERFVEIKTRKLPRELW